MNLKSLKKILGALAILWLMEVPSSYGQPGDDPPGNPPVPISGIGYLLALGGALGIKKIYDLRNNRDID